ncbi:MAG TPA: ferritin [Solirubrobacteraceae bacterium]|nr:ferritin [Solirubrobacteraceae bacterium]
MPVTVFASRLNEQIANEFAAHQQYVACAVYYEGQTLPQLAGFFYRQALEERGHAMMMIQYLLDTGAEVTTPGIIAPRTTFADAVEPVGLALSQEREVSQQINALAATARDEGDFAAEQFVQWFIAEQIEEVATMSDLMTVAERSRDRVAEIEDFLAREHPGQDGPDAGAPRQAGGQ